MATVITRAFEHWQAQQVLNNLPARPDTIIFAHVPGQDSNAEINPDEAIPADGQIVHRDAVAQYGMINDSAVAYSVVLDTRAGDFTFNWIGLVDAASNTLCMIVHTLPQQKMATANGVQGNNITRTFLMEFAGAAEASQITVSAQTWQIDFSARLRGIDETVRLANLDYYGHEAFFSDGFAVTQDGDKYRVNAGLAYIGGIRALLADDVLLEAAAGNVIYADVSYQGSVLSEFAPIIHIGVKSIADDFGDYVDANRYSHYLTKMAVITTDGIDDSRVALSSDEAINEAIERMQADLKAHTESRDHPDATLIQKGFAQLNSDTDSDSETQAATPKAVKKAVNTAVTAMGDHVQGDNPHDQYLQIHNLLSEIVALGPEAVARLFTNLGLGNAAQLNVGTVAGTVAAGNDSRIVNAIQSTNAAISLPGSLYTAGTINGSTITAAGNIAAGNGAAWLPADGNVYGPIWGGYLSNYLGGISNQANSYGVVALARGAAQAIGQAEAPPGAFITFSAGTSGNIKSRALYMQRTNGAWVQMGGDIG
ncbi:tail fiber repeat 2-containing protein [Yersinia frederiksenii]|nr:tail fiber repeat 2-containing protein [Yersinia frederiksenii]